MKIDLLQELWRCMAHRRQRSAVDSLIPCSFRTEDSTYSSSWWECCWQTSLHRQFSSEQPCLNDVNLFKVMGVFSGQPEANDWFIGQRELLFRTTVEVHPGFRAPHGSTEGIQTASQLKPILCPILLPSLPFSQC